MVAVVQLVRASDCGSECRRFESDQPPQALQLQGFFVFCRKDTSSKESNPLKNYKNKTYILI